MLFKGTCDTEFFNAWLEKRFCPAVKKKSIVVIDNAAFHKSKKTEQLIRAAGCELLFLPPYSPDLMPIEQKFAVLKRHRSNNHHLSLSKVIKIYA